MWCARSPYCTGSSAHHPERGRGLRRPRRTDHGDFVTGAVAPHLALGWSCVANPRQALAYLCFFRMKLIAFVANEAVARHILDHLGLDSTGPPVDGAVLLFRGETAAVAEDFARADPYVVQGLVVSWRVREWTTVAGWASSPPRAPAVRWA
jgi:hypothetical protein